MALFLAIKSLGIGKGDEAIVPVLTFTATAEAVVQAGAKPVFVEIREDTLLINPEEIRKRITKKTKAIMGVHLYGLPIDITEIKKIITFLQYNSSNQKFLLVFSKQFYRFLSL